MESWRSVWRKGFAPLLSTESLEALRQALVSDDPRLLQGATTTPPPLHAVQDWPVEAACVLGYCGVADLGGFVKNDDGTLNDGAAVVGDVEEFFQRMCFAAYQQLGEPAACRWFLNWFDDTPRDEMRRELLVEVQRTLAQRLAADEEPAS